MLAVQKKAGEVAARPAGSGANQADGSLIHTKYNEPFTKSQAPNLRVALAYARRGMAIFPVWPIREDGRCSCGRPDCEHPGKHPIGSCAPHGWKDATTNEATIRRWFDRYPRANIGWSLPHDVVVIDVDPRNGGDALNLPLTWSDRQTLTAHTGGGGDHLIYRLPPADPEQRWMNGSLGDGLDVKTFGGYIILAPSNHASGGVYAWADDLGPNEAEILPAPPALLSILPVETRPTGNFRPSPATTTTRTLSENLHGRMIWVLTELCEDFRPDQARAKVICPFHDDHNPSFEYDLNRGVFHCHAPGCPAHNARGDRGGVRGLERLAREIHGLVYRRPDPEEAAAATPGATGEGFAFPSPAAPAIFSTTTGEGPRKYAEPSPAAAICSATPRRTVPWAITREDWGACPICAAWNHTTRATGGGLALRVHHLLCRKRGCQVSDKARAHDLFEGLESWPAIYTATIDPDDWDKLRVRFRRAGARSFGIPTAGGVVAICDQADVLPGGAITEDLGAIFAAFQNRTGRVRRPQTRTRERLDADDYAALAVDLGELAPVTAVTKFAAPNTDETREALAENAVMFGERLDVLRAENTAEPPAELTALARQLTVRGLPPDAISRIHAAWANVGIVADGNRAFATIEQARALLAEITEIRREVNRAGLRDLFLYGGTTSPIETKRASSPDAGEAIRGDAADEPRQDRRNGERGQQLCLKTYC